VRTPFVLPLIERSRLGRALLIGYLAFSTVYLACGHWHLRPPLLLEPGVLDTSIPFLPWTLWIYLSQFVLLMTALACARDDHDRSRTYYAMLVATLVAALVFLAWPTKLERPPVTGQGLTEIAWRLLYLSDTPTNCFPSLHVALALLSAAALVRRGAGWRLAAPVWAAAIALSTLTTRQHVVLDIAGGFLLAPMAWILTGTLFAYERTPAALDAGGR
jgi:membrane-associated phospholipid phosphatase